MGSLFSLPLDRITRQLIFLSPKKPFCTCIHSWEKECTGRPGFSSGALGYKWDAGSQISGIHIPEVFSFPTGGPLCFEPHFEIILFFSPCSVPEAPQGDALEHSFDWKFFQLILDFPPSAFMSGMPEVPAAPRVLWFY